MRIRLDLAYDGTDFNGWAKQPGLRTVQGVLEDALGVLLRKAGAPPLLVVAGRTDAGVHARAQVAHLDLSAAHREALYAVRGALSDDPGAALAYRLNGILGADSDIVVHRGSVAPAGFDARFSAVWRHYEYRISDAPENRDPVQRRRTAWLSAVLDDTAMSEASGALLGLHDFAAYCKPREGATTIRTLQRFEWRRDGEGTLTAAVQADAFCHSMVRSLVGGAVAVGEGRLEPARLAAILAGGERTSAFAVMPAHGLSLVEIAYPADDALAARAEQTRARRG